MLAIFSEPAATTGQRTITLPKVDRIIITVDVPDGGGACRLGVTQGAIANMDNVVQDADFVYDVTP